MNFKINFQILKKCKEVGHCVCDLSKTCPCDDWLNNQECICGAYKEVKG